MNSCGTLFTYPALDHGASQIRIIRLQPRCENESITCHLYVSDLEDEDCKYEALSYEWGEATSNQHISLDGKDIGIRENLWWALRHLRAENVERIIWIDALCIDQNNEMEKNHQVSLMGRIYSRASRVVAWLGREGEEDLAQVAKVAAWVRLKKDEGHSGDLLPLLRHYSSISDTSPDEKLPTDGIRRPSEAEYHLVRTLWHRICGFTYWSRLWIVQELILAKNLFLKCGSVELDWEILSSLFQDPSHILRPPTPPPGQMPTGSPHEYIPHYINSERSGIWQEPPVLSWQFHLYRKGECADVRDRIFGLLGISAQCCQENIPVDYGLSSIDLALSFIAHDERMHQPFRSGSSSHGRAHSLIQYLGCEDENSAQRIVAAIEALDGPLWPPFCTPEEEQELWRRHDNSVITYIEGGQLVFRFLGGESGHRTESIENGSPSEQNHVN